MEAAALKITPAGDGVELSVLAKPRASKTVVRGVALGALEIALAAPPVDGEANAELVRFLSRTLDVPKRDVTIVSGDRGKHKRVHIARIAEGVARARIEALLLP